MRAALDVEALRAAAGARWARIDVVEETASTNADLLADASAPDRTVLAAEHQRSGRGRLDRTWISPPRAGLTFSVLLRPTVPIATWGWLPLLAGVAVHEAVVSVGTNAALKWPNDLLCGTNGNKLGGVLAQTSGEAVVIGIGLNVTTTEDELPGEAATSLERCGAGTLDRTALLVLALSHLDARAGQWSDVAGDAEASGLAEAYRRSCDTLGRPVAVTTIDGAALTGTAVDIDSSGRLLLDTSTGQIAVGAGDVQHLRPDQ